MRLLKIKSNPKNLINSACLRIEDALVNSIVSSKNNETLIIEELDVYKEEIPLLDYDFLPVFFSRKAINEETKLKLEKHEHLLEQFLRADIIVIATPMWNFSYPPMLKAYIDNILVPGKTFKYTTGGPAGLVTGKRVYLCVATGGEYEGELAKNDFLVPLLKKQFELIGINDVTVIKASSQAINEVDAKKSLEEAFEKAEVLGKHLSE